MRSGSDQDNDLNVKMIYIKYLNGLWVLYGDHFLTNSLRFTRLSSCLYMVTLMARSYSSNTLDALKVMAQLIHLARKKKGLTAQALADKAGVSRGLIHRIERADPKCEIGVVFELASLLGVRLFSVDIPLSVLGETLESKIAVLPKAVRTNAPVVSNDF